MSRYICPQFLDRTFLLNTLAIHLSINIIQKMDSYRNMDSRDILSNLEEDITLIQAFRVRPPLQDYCIDMVSHLERLKALEVCCRSTKEYRQFKIQGKELHGSLQSLLKRYKSSSCEVAQKFLHDKVEYGHEKRQRKGDASQVEEDNGRNDPNDLSPVDIDGNSDTGDVGEGAQVLRGGTRSELPEVELSRRLKKSWPSGPAVKRGGRELEVEILERIFSFMEAFQMCCTSGYSLLCHKHLPKKSDRSEEGRPEQESCSKKRKNSFSEADLPLRKVREDHGRKGTRF